MAKKAINLISLLIPFAASAGIAAGDIYLKEWMEEELPKKENEEIKKGIFKFKRYHNRGALLNLGQKYPAEVKAISVFSTGVTFLSLLFSMGKKGRVLEKAGLSMVLGGAISNSYDRVKKGYVMDYATLDVKNKKISNIVFNLSDVFIGIGTLFIFISNMTAKDRTL